VPAGPSTQADLPRYFTGKKCLLLNALHTRGAVSTENVLNAVYGKKRAQSTEGRDAEMDKLRVLVRRTNIALAEKELRWEIKHDAGTYELTPV
jgi:hypothetical protein